MGDRRRSLSCQRSFLRSSIALPVAACLALALGAGSLPLAAQPELTFSPGLEFPIDSPRPNGQVVGQPRIVKAPGVGRILVLWTRGGSDGAARAIWAREIDEGFLPQLTGEGVLARAAPGRAIVDFRVSCNWDHYALSWRTLDPATHQSELFVRVFDLYLHPVGPPLKVALDPVETPGRAFAVDGPRAGLDDAGRLVVAWLEEIDLHGLGRTDQSWLRVRRYAVDGSLERDERYGTIEGSRALALNVAPRGAFLAAWEEDDADADTIVRARLYPADTALPPRNLDPGQGTGFCRHSSRTPAVASLYESFFLAFADPLGRTVQGPPGATSPLCFGLFGQAYDLAGNPLREEFRIKRNSFAPLIATNRSQYLVTWVGNPPAPPGAPRQPGAYAHPFRDDGQSYGPDFFLQSQPVSDVAFYGFIAIVVWNDHGVKAKVWNGHRP